ncbi:hypothetical protein [Flavihumibacter fluvii]|uniref:hypothetical protein n=1 Tax=Flavihumibacter fluvii TaxID=2838157 RepID=UPI001BDF5672|nr:hypothetical protein [Flavihumibacter fluvii]ULQ50742.1 hypothetical protein KJS93_11680 [Flavihumibacter fluvii]
MRTLLLFLGLVSFISLEAQMQSPLAAMNFSQRDAYPLYHALSDSNNANKKWSLYKYGGISTSYSFFNGGNATVFSAPIGLQLNRRLNNNLYAFAGVSVAPAYYNFNHSFIHADLNKNNPGANRLNTSGVGMYSRFEAGLMYMNDEKTFSISGSIGIERSSYPAYPYNNRTDFQRQQPISGSRQ